MPSQTATILVTDLVGSTELRSRIGDKHAERLRRLHDRLWGRRGSGPPPGSGPACRPAPAPVIRDRAVRLGHETLDSCRAMASATFVARTEELLAATR